MLKRSRFISTGTEEAASSNDNTWGFIDGTVRVVCRPSHQDPIVQNNLYNGHHRYS